MEKHILVLAYPGAGKTYLADNYNDVSDFEFQHYRYDYGRYKHLPLEKLKGRTEIRKNNKNWPKNFFEALDNEIKNKKIVLIPFATSLLEILDYLQKTNNCKIIFAIHDRNNFKELESIFRKRGNKEEFINRRKNDFQKCHNIISNSKYEKVYISKSEFLSDSLIRIGVKLEKGKGTKNYI